MELHFFHRSLCKWAREVPKKPLHWRQIFPKEIEAQVRSEGLQDAAKKIAEGDRDVLCKQGLSIEEARNYTSRKHRPPKSSGLCFALQTITITKTMVVSSDCENSLFQNTLLDPIEYMEGVARAYKRGFDEACKMCGDEFQLHHRRKEILQKMGFETKPKCKPNPDLEPEVVVLYEDHTVQERGAAPTAKRGLLQSALPANPGILVLTESLSHNAPPIAQARLLNFFKLPVDKSRLAQEGGFPILSDPDIRGLDDDHLIAARTLQISLMDIEGLYLGGSMSKENRTKKHREAFFEFVTKNQGSRDRLLKISEQAGDNPPRKPIFGKESRLPMDDELNKIWSDPRYAPIRTTIGQLAEAFYQNASTAAIGINTLTKKSYWDADFKKITAEANIRYQNFKFDDVAFHSLLRTLLHLEMNEIPAITTPESAGGLLRDWVFTEKVKSAICETQTNQNPPKKIIVNVGSAHATRLADFLRADGFATNKLRFLNADALDASNVMTIINSSTDHKDHIENAQESYREACRGYRPSAILTPNGAPIVPASPQR